MDYSQSMVSYNEEYDISATPMDENYSENYNLYLCTFNDVHAKICCYKMYKYIVSNNELDAIYLFETVKNMPQILEETNTCHFYYINENSPTCTIPFLYLAIKHSMHRLMTLMCRRHDYNKYGEEYDADATATALEMSADVVNESAIISFMRGEVDVLKQVMQFKTFDWKQLICLEYYYVGCEEGEEYTIQHCKCLRVLFRYICKHVLKNKTLGEKINDMNIICNEFYSQIQYSKMYCQKFVPLLFIQYFPFVLDNSYYKDQWFYKDIIRDMHVIMDDYNLLIETHHRYELDTYLGQVKQTFRLLMDKGIFHTKERINFLSMIDMNVEFANPIVGIYLQNEFIQREIVSNLMPIENSHELDEDIMRFMKLSSKKRRICGKTNRK